MGSLALETIVSDPPYGMDVGWRFRIDPDADFSLVQRQLGTATIVQQAIGPAGIRWIARLDKPLRLGVRTYRILAIRVTSSLGSNRYAEVFGVKRERLAGPGLTATRNLTRFGRADLIRVE